MLENGSKYALLGNNWNSTWFCTSVLSAVMEFRQKSFPAKVFRQPRTGFCQDLWQSWQKFGQQRQNCTVWKL